MVTAGARDYYNPLFCRWKVLRFLFCSAETCGGGYRGLLLSVDSCRTLDQVRVFCCTTNLVVRQMGGNMDGKGIRFITATAQSFNHGRYF